VQGKVFFWRGVEVGIAIVGGGVVVVSVGVITEWTVEDGGGGGAIGAGDVVVEGREKGVGGSTEYCVGPWRGSPVVVFAGMGSSNVAGIWGTPSSVVASKSFTSIASGVAKSKLNRSEGSLQSGRSVVSVARKCDSENLNVGSG
jgi:hypothetical protein